ncbi:MAG: hypothetical protein ACUVWP_06745 [bacterium]
MKIIIPGIYPRSEKLVSATRDFDRKRISLEKLEIIRREDIKAFIELQNDFEFSSTGLFNWQDLLRPFSEIVENLRVDGLIRFYETNTFVKALEFRGDIKLVEDEIIDWINRYFTYENYIQKTSNLLLSFPFLYIFKSFTKGITTKQIAELLTNIISYMPISKRNAICFIEPTFGFRKIEDDERKEGMLFLDNIKTKVDCPIFIHTFFFPIKDDKDFIFKLPIDGIGIDFYSNSLSEIMDGFPHNKLLIAGIMNVQSTLIENRDKISSFTEKLTGFINPDDIYLSTNGPPELLPRTIMDEKIEKVKETV